jgi:hypothetical protein
MEPTTHSSDTIHPGTSTTHAGTTTQTAPVEGRPAAAERFRHHPTTAGDYWADRWDLDVLERLRPFGQILLLAGLVLAMLARGWDAVGDRHAQAANSRVQQASSEFHDQWEDQFDRLDAEEASIRASQNFDARDRDRLSEIRQERRDLERDRDVAQARAEKQWRDLERSARETQAENQLTKPWREGLFVFGSVLFALGLLGYGFTTEGPVRWFCLVLLAIVVIGTFFNPDWVGSAREVANR